MDGDSRGYPIVALSFQRDRDVHVGIIHVNQRDRNGGGGIWSRDDFRDGGFLGNVLVGTCEFAIDISHAFVLVGDRADGLR